MLCVCSLRALRTQAKRAVNKYSLKVFTVVFPWMATYYQQMSKGGITCSGVRDLSAVALGVGGRGSELKDR